MKAHFSIFAFSYAFEIKEASYLLHQKIEKKLISFQKL